METKMSDHMVNGIKALNIDVKNMTGYDTIRLNQYINLLYPEHPHYNFVIYGYKGERRVTIATHSMGKLDRYELFGYSVGGGCTYSSATGVTTKREKIIYSLDGYETVK